MKTRIVLIALIAAFAMPSAFAAKVSVLGAAEYGGLNKATLLTLESKGDIGFGGGLLFEVPMGKTVGLELGGIFLQRKIKTTGTNPITGDPVDQSDTFQLINAPVAFRFWMSPKFSIHVGGYYDYSLEEGGEYDYGASAGFRLNIPTKSGAFFIEPRYNHALRSIDGVSSDSKTILGLVGFTFGK